LVQVGRAKREDLAQAGSRYHEKVPPWLSVIVPTYNGDAYLPAMLASLEANDLEGVELIVVDDGSCDATLAILEKAAGRLPLRVHAGPRVGNWVATTNMGLRLATGTWVSFLHQDDVWLPGRTRRLRCELTSFVGVLALHPAVFVAPGGGFLGSWRCPLAPGRIRSVDFMSRLLVQNFVAIPSPVFRRDVALSWNGLDESLWYTADWDLWLRLGSLGDVLYCDEALSGFRIHPASQTMDIHRTRADIDRQQCLVFERHVSEWKRHVDGSEARRVERAARFSIRVNSMLAGAYRGERAGWSGLVGQLLALGPLGWHRYVRDSRITERVGARLRAHRSHWQ